MVSVHTDVQHLSPPPFRRNMHIPRWNDYRQFPRSFYFLDSDASIDSVDSSVSLINPFIDYFVFYFLLWLMFCLYHHFVYGVFSLFFCVKICRSWELFLPTHDDSLSAPTCVLDKLQSAKKWPHNGKKRRYRSFAECPIRRRISVLSTTYHPWTLMALPTIISHLIRTFWAFSPSLPLSLCVFEAVYHLYLSCIYFLATL